MSSNSFFLFCLFISSVSSFSLLHFYTFVFSTSTFSSNLHTYFFKILLSKQLFNNSSSFCSRSCCFLQLATLMKEQHYSSQFCHSVIESTCSLFMVTLLISMAQFQNLCRMLSYSRKRDKQMKQ